jgi:hypothetical protein
MKVVSVRLGHSSTGFTANRYTHVVPAVAKDAADRIAHVVSLVARREKWDDAATRSPRCARLSPASWG